MRLLSEYRQYLKRERASVKQMEHNKNNIRDLKPIVIHDKPIQNTKRQNI